MKYWGQGSSKPNKSKIGGVESRINFHRRAEKRERPMHRINEMIKENGWKNFEVETWEVSEEHLDACEKCMIFLYNTIWPNGYNGDSGGHKNKHPSDETKKKIGEANSISLLGKKLSTEHKLNISKQTAGEKNPMWGQPSYWRNKTFSDEHKRKISESKIGKFRVPFEELSPQGKRRRRLLK